MRHIVITAGHSNTDPGATNGVLTEAHIVTEFRNMVSFYLTRDNIEHTTDGVRDENLPLRDAINLIQPGSLAVEFHCNAFSNPAATGVETLSQEKDKPIGASLCRCVADSIGITNRGAKSEGSGQHSRLGFVRAGGIILELFFISNPDDTRRYLDKRWVVARDLAYELVRLAR